MKTAMAMAVAALITVASSWLQPGQLYEQTPDDVLLGEAQRLDGFPTAFGHWQYEQDGVDLPAKVQQELGLAKYVSRIYRNPETDQKVGVLVMVGNPGRLVRHPPDICYSNRGSRSLAAEGADIDDEGRTHHFRVLSYASDNPLEPNGQFVVAYGHAAGGEWDTPRYPRYTYGGEPYLYKMQVLVSAGEDTQDRIETARMFLADFVKAFATIQNAES